MSNPLEPGNHRNNWLEKEESDTSWYEEIIQMFIQSMKKQLETIRQNHQATVASNRTRILFEYMLNQKDPSEFLDKDLLRELKEAPVMLIKPDGKWYDPYPLDSSDLELDEDPNDLSTDELDFE
jgi:hypothetical protein